MAVAFNSERGRAVFKAAGAAYQGFATSCESGHAKEGRAGLCRSSGKSRQAMLDKVFLSKAELSNPCWLLLRWS